MVDDPYVFGQVAAANALSDIYAMGGEPKVALNIVAWPNCVNPKFLGEILRGGADKVKEAGAVLAGGHSIQDDVPKYGLSVTGLVHPDKVYKNCGAEPGDVLVLSKPLGTGIVNIAVKAEMASEEAEAEVIRVMTTLNKKAKEILEKFPVHACTDVTGFGLAGHAMEMGGRKPGRDCDPRGSVEGSDSGFGVRPYGAGSRRGIQEPAIHRRPDADRSGSAGRETGYRL